MLVQNIFIVFLLFVATEGTIAAQSSVLPASNFAFTVLFLIT